MPRRASLTEFAADPALGELQKKLSEVLEAATDAGTSDLAEPASIDVQMLEIAETLRDLRKWHAEINNVMFIGKSRK